MPEVTGVTAFKPHPEINPCGNRSEVWKRWKQKYNLYMYWKRPQIPHPTSNK